MAEQLTQDRPQAMQCVLDKIELVQLALETGIREFERASQPELPTIVPPRPFVPLLPWIALTTVAASVGTCLVVAVLHGLYRMA